MIRVVAGLVVGLTVVASPAGATPAGNRAATRAEVHRLLSSAPLPWSARRIDTASGPLARGPLSGEPVGAGVIARHRFYRVAMSFPRASRWIASHAPAGLNPSGSGAMGSNGRVVVRDVTFADRDSSAWTQAQLTIGVERGPDSSTVWRIDGSALWLDPRPIRDTARGPRLRVTPATGCPASDASRRDVRNAGARLDHHMLPPGRATRVLLCSYHGMNGEAFHLRAHRRYGPRVAGQLARRLRTMSLSHVDGLELHCPMDDASADVVDLGFANRPDVDIWVSPTGCGYVDNGHIVGGDVLSRAVSRLLR